MQQAAIVVCAGVPQGGFYPLDSFRSTQRK